MKLMPAGRARWRIENETFNTGMPATLKNQGYHFEYNFVAQAKAGRKLYFWEKVQALQR